jgi:hypothetical protein
VKRGFLPVSGDINKPSSPFTKGGVISPALIS